MGRETGTAKKKLGRLPDKLKQKGGQKKTVEFFSLSL